MTQLPARFVLYAYTGTTTTAAQAYRRPNAYQFDLQNGLVCDAGSLATSSPARWVNTQVFHKSGCCNCEYKEYQGKLYVITLRSIAPMQELFASCGEGKTPYAEWPQGFLGDGYLQVSQYRDYLLDTPKGATSTQKKHAKELLAYLKEDLDSEGLDRDLEAAAPFMNVLSEFMAAAGTAELSVLLDKLLTKCDIELQSQPKGTAKLLADSQSTTQDALSKLAKLDACKDLHDKCARAMSAMHHAVKHLHTMQEAGQVMAAK